MIKAIWVAAATFVLVLGCTKERERQGEPARAEEHDGHAHGKEPSANEKGEKGDHARAPAQGEHADHDDHGDEDDASAKERVVTLSPEAVRAAGIATVEAARRQLAIGLTAPARVTFTQTGVARVAPRAAGRLDTIEVRLGQRVRQGTVLGYLESPELGRARAEYLASATRERVAEANLNREKELLQKGITSEREMREAESAWAVARGEMTATEAHLHALGISDQEIAALKLKEHPSARFPARSPIDGTVVEIHGTVGQTVESTTPLFTIGDLSNLWVLLDVFESQLALIEVGQSVAITVDALSGRTFEGRIAYVGDVVDEKTRAIRVRVVVQNRDGLLKPGMFATAKVAGRTGPGSTSSLSVIVPREAVQTLGDGHVVFVPEGDNKFRVHEVLLGADAGKEIEIVKGLEPGVKVVTTGAFVLKSEASKEAMSGSHAGHGH